MFFGKPWEFWVAVFGAAVYVATRDAEKAPIPKRILKVITSGAFGYALADDLAPLTRSSESLAAVIIMVFGIVILDLASALITDRDLMTSIIRKRLGGGSKDDNDGK